ncbi:21753_t:CDS:2 [Cetraspora pellucida]|uniref:21753_t:CDS:1 n=1 Tax=Cetraspora pellucida TaxID=1433469 RepID=A0A9N9GWX1_9GLOM|nr:21753_t:CDS:2 [Cetraspora pellucida]
MSNEPRHAVGLEIRYSSTNINMHLKELISDTEKRGINKINYSEFESFETISETGFCHVVKSEWQGCKLDVVLKKSHSDMIIQEVSIYYKLIKNII